MISGKRENIRNLKRSRNGRRSTILKTQKISKTTRSKNITNRGRITSALINIRDTGRTDNGRIIRIICGHSPKILPTAPNNAHRDKKSLKTKVNTTKKISRHRWQLNNTTITKGESLIRNNFLTENRSKSAYIHGKQIFKRKVKTATIRNVNLTPAENR